MARSNAGECTEYEPVLHGRFRIERGVISPGKRRKKKGVQKFQAVCVAL